MPYKNPQAVSLATEIVKDFLGEGAATVCKHLLTKGQQTLQDMIRGIPDMPSSQVKRNLLVLVQHNLANAYTQPEEVYMKSRRASFHAYEACPDRIIQTVRYARFILHIKKELGEVAEKIIEALLENGRLRFDQLSSAVTARCDHLLSAEADNVDQPESLSSAGSPNSNSSTTPTAVNLEERIRNVFVSLVQSYYIERVPPCDLPPPLHKTHINAIKKKAGSKANLVAEEVVQSAKTLPELVYSKQRFRLPTDVIMGSSSSSAPASKTMTAAAADPKLSNDNDNNNSSSNATEAAAANDKSTGANRKKNIATAIPAAAAAAIDEAADDVFGARAPPSKRQKLRAGTAKAADMTGILLGGGAGASHSAGSSNNSNSTNGASSSFASGAGYMTEAELQDRLAAEPAFVLWRVNNDEFNRRFRHQKVAKVVGDKLGADAGVVVAAMLNATRASEKQVAEKQSALMTEEEVAGVAMKLGESGVLPKLSFLAASSSAAAAPTAQVSAILHRIGADGLEAVSYSGTSLGGGSSYAVHMDKSVQAVRQVQLESVVRQKFGISGRRVLRLLFIRGHLEQKQVSDFSMLPAKDTRELLYGMLKEGFVFMQEVPRTSDRAPSRTIFTWYVDFNKSFSVLGSEVLKTMRNVWMRRRFEMERCKDLLDRIEEMQMAAALANSSANNNSNSNSGSNNEANAENKGNGNSTTSTAAPPAPPMPAFTFTEAQRKKLAMLNSVERILTSSLLRLDDMSALYNDF